MIVAFSIFILICLVVLLDYWIQSIPKAVLLLFSILSFFYQIAFLFNLKILFSLVDLVSILFCLFFYKVIFSQLRRYCHQIFVAPSHQGEKILYLLYLFIGYLFFLSIFAVPGLNWDSMIYHLPKPFLYLSEGTIFTPHYSDGRQTLWPMGWEILTYIFTRTGETFGVGFFQFIFYVGMLILVYQAAIRRTDPKRAVTLTLIVASMPVLVYGATTVKTDMVPILTFLMMWLSFEQFHQNRSQKEFFWIFLALAFGITTKLTFLILGPLTLIAFTIIEWFDRPKETFFQKEKFSWQVWIPLCLVLLFIAQTHIFVYNLLHHGHLSLDMPLMQFTPNYALKKWDWSLFITLFQDLIKHQLMLIDFVFPLSWADIPFVDTALSFFYNRTIGKLTGDKLLDYHYFPEEMRASFGPFAILILWAVYRTCFRKGEKIAKAFALTFLIWLVFVAYLVPWGAVSGIRYLGPCLVGSLIFLPLCYQSKWLQFQKTVRGIAIGLLVFSCIFNYASPLIAYHSKAVPWYRYAFTDRGYLYHQKYFLDNRMEIYQQLLNKNNRIFVFSHVSDWVFPYYYYGRSAKIRLGNYQNDQHAWESLDFNQYDLVICNDFQIKQCIKEWDHKEGFQKVWKSAPDNKKIAAFYERARKT